MRILGLSIILFFIYLSATAQTSEEARHDNEIAARQKIKIFPNPATTVVNILGVVNTTKANISISDVYGKEVLNLVREIRNESISIAIPNLEAGIFVIRITSEEQQVHTKFYKQ